MLLVIPNDAFFEEILFFSNIFGFHSIWRIFQTLFFLLETTSSQNFINVKQYLGE